MPGQTFSDNCLRLCPDDQPVIAQESVPFHVPESSRLHPGLVLEPRIEHAKTRGERKEVGRAYGRAERAAFVVVLHHVEDDHLPAGRQRVVALL